ncbi:homeobox protein 3-like [Vespula squamosa]|uniref:Homeobox protein 3-like n=1 Tax=Vespula squamosa TaxID=30214 RepID=A0ABD2A8N1_VESSQ
MQREAKKISDKRNELDDEHVKSRNKILEALEQIQNYDTSQSSYDSDRTYFSVTHTDEEICSPVLEDLLIELNISRLEKQLCAENNDLFHSICSYCRHIFEIPKNFIKSMDDTTLSPLTKCKADLSFLQAIVWLKSVAIKMREIPVEEYNMIFNVFTKVPKHNIVQSLSHINDLSLSKLQENYKKNMICTSPILSNKEFNDMDLLSSKSCKPYYDFNGHDSKELYKDKRNCTNINNIEDQSDPLTPQRWNNLCTINECVSENLIIPESDEELTINSENLDNIYQGHCITPDLFSLENNSLNYDESNISEKHDSAYDTLNIDQDSIVFSNSINEEIHNKCLQKKRKLKMEDISRKRSKYTKKNISTGWVNFTLRTLETNNIVMKSIQIILRVFKNENIVKEYLKRKYWIDTLEKEALDAILNFSNIFRLEMKSDICDRVVLQAIEDTLEEIYQVTNFKKTTLQIYHISIILEFCNSPYICNEIINFHIKKLDDVQITLKNIFKKKSHGIHNVINIVHLILYALNICLQKYTIIIRSNKKNTEHNIISSVTNLWLKQWKIDQACDEKTKEQKNIEKWANSLEAFTITYIDDIPLLAEKSRRLYLMLVT